MYEDGNLLITLAIVIMGLIFGSFGSVIFFRLGEIPSWKVMKGFLFGRSECQKCHHQLHRYDLFPIFSFLSTGGKCRYCKISLSWRYPVLEIGSVLCFVGTYKRFCSFGLIPGGEILTAILVWLLFLNAMYDFYKYELHITASIGAFILVLILNVMAGTNWIYFIQSFGLFLLVFLLIYLFARLFVWVRYREKGEGFGFGDVLFSGVIGGMIPLIFQNLGMLDIFQVMCVWIIYACIIGLMMFVGIKLFSRSPLQKGVIPFVPAMTIGLFLLIISKNLLLNYLYFFVY